MRVRLVKESIEEDKRYYDMHDEELYDGCIIDIEE